MDNQQEERYELYSKQPLKKESHVFLLDHQLSFKIPELRKHLYENDVLMARLQNMLKYGLTKKDAANLEAENQGLGKLEETFDCMNISNPLKYIIHKDTLCLSFYGNQIENLSWVDQLLDDNRQLKMLWLNDNPLDMAQLTSMVESQYPNIEVLNSQFTSSIGHFGMKMTALEMDAERFNSTPDGQVISLDWEGRAAFQMAQEKVAEMGGMFPSVIRINMTDNTTDRNTFLSFMKTLLSAFPCL